MHRFILAIASAITAFQLSPAAIAEGAHPKLEFRIAETTASDGLSKHDVPGNGGTVFVTDRAIVTGDDIEKVSFFDDEAGNPAIGFELTAEGSTKLWSATSANVGKQLAVMLDGEVVSAPKIYTGIRDKGRITGKFNDEDLTRIFRAIVLGSSSPD